MRTVLIIACLFLGNLLIGQAPMPFQKKYGISLDLHQAAHTVVRKDDRLIKVSSPAKMKVEIHQIKTILNQVGAEKAVVVLHYNGYKTISNLSLSVKSVDGLELRRFKHKDFKDVAFLEDLSLVNEARYLFIDLRMQKPPFTIELKYTESHTGTLTYPDFLPQASYNQSVESARCVVRIPNTQTLYFKNNRCAKPVITQEGNFTQYTWSMRKLQAIPNEPYNLPLSQMVPYVRLSPGQFQISGHKGSYKSWDTFAAWNQQLLSKLQPLNPKTVAWVKQQTKGMTELEKIETIYRLLQNSTRYISLQLGIGGWQPFDPNFVHEKKYGDCKALSWYTHNLLKAVGIQSYYTLIDSGTFPRELDPQFPATVFNHAILTVPTSAGDTVWLECTSQTYPFGYVGTHISKRRALAINNGQGAIIQMPDLPATANVHTDSVRVQLSADGKKAEIDWLVELNGMAIEDEGFMYVLTADPQDQKDWVEKTKSVKGGRVSDFKLRLNRDAVLKPIGQVSLRASSTKLSYVSSKRLYIRPNFFQPWTEDLRPDTARVSPVFCRYGQQRVADLSLSIPAGMTPEMLPKAIEEQTPFGCYTRTVSFENGKLHYRRTIVLEAGTFPAAQYNDMVAFFNKMRKWDGERAVFNK